jgi:tetratricopeptide (TPR) repeat protein
MAMVVQNQGDLDEAFLLYQEGLDTCRRIKDEPGTANALLNLGALYYYKEDFPRAKDLFEECRLLSQAIGHRPLYVRSIHNLGVAARDQGNLETAQSLLEESLRLLREAEDKYGLGAVWEDLGLLAVEKGDFAEASDFYSRSLNTRQETGERIGVAFTLQNMGLLAAVQKEAKRAVLLLGVANALCDALGSPLPPQQQRRQENVLPGLVEAVGDAAFTRLWDAGQALTLEEGVALALNNK